MERIAWSAKRILSLAVLFVLASVSGCTSAYSIEEVTRERFAPTSSIELLKTKPDRNYLVIAIFKGDERGDCPADQPYCSLVKRAQELGAHAIWIQSKRVYRQYDKWEMIEGKLTKLRGFTIETVEGVFVRYIE